MFNICVSNEPIISSENILKLNYFLSEIEIEKNNKIYQINSIEEYFNIFDIGIQKNNLGIFHIFYKKENNVPNYKDCFEPILKYFKNKTHLRFANNIKYTIRKEKLVRIY